MVNLKKNTRTRALRHIIVVSLLTLLSASGYADTQNELSGVSNEISRQKQSLSAQENKYNQLQKDLRSQELQIADIEKNIKATEKKLAQSQNRNKQLATQFKALKHQKQQQSARLAQLIKTYYVTKQSRSAVNVLRDDSEEDRISQYFQYLAKERAATLQNLETTEQSLSQTSDKLRKEQQRIKNLLKEQQHKRQQLTSTQTKRRSTLTKIQRNISSDKHYLAELRRNETRLKAEIAKAKQRNAILMDGLTKERGKLPWPVKGSILHSFGTRQSGEIRWKGVVIKAKYGEPVHAVYSGTVVFADYLRGYGLVVLLDHGKGDMTLYGYNQSLLKREGDKVKAGEIIAQVGDTGGQETPSLYFEIRRNSHAQNPIKWLTH